MPIVGEVVTIKLNSKNRGRWIQTILYKEQEYKSSAEATDRMIAIACKEEND